jgi:thiol:disulfide interchange protein
VVVHTAARSLAAGAAVALLASALACSRPEPGSAAGGSEAISTHGTVAVEWGRDLPAALSRARSEGKPVVVNFYADWCVWCKRLDSTTLRDAQVASLLRDRVVPVSLDVDGDGRDLSVRYSVEGLPTILVLDADGREIGRIPGYMPPTGFLERIEELIGPATRV